jgi:hypothetical protein
MTFEFPIGAVGRAAKIALKMNAPKKSDAPATRKKYRKTLDNQKNLAQRRFRSSLILHFDLLAELATFETAGVCHEDYARGCGHVSGPGILPYSHGHRGGRR